MRTCMHVVYCRYKRYLQSKDLSAVTSEDLDCVLGRKRSRQSSPEVKQVREKRTYLTPCFTVSQQNCLCAHVCPRVPMCAHVCPRVPTCAHVCPCCGEQCPSCWSIASFPGRFWKIREKGLVSTVHAYAYLWEILGILCYFLCAVMLHVGTLVSIFSQKTYWLHSWHFYHNHATKELSRHRYARSK